MNKTNKSTKLFLGGAIITIVVIVVWVTILVPLFLKMPTDFSYRAGVQSFDNFYDEGIEDFKGEERTVTNFTYDVIGQEGDILAIKNIFAVRTVFGDPVFSVEREYGINRTTGEHVTGFGDKDRNGYLFAPRNLSTGEGYTYWHINYDTPAEMEYVDTEDIGGLKVFHFRSKDLTADQTENLTFLPGVGESRGVRLSVDLETWVEPTTGYLVKYEDHTLANYYDLVTGETIHPWNKFHNQYDETSIDRQVVISKSLKRASLFMTYGVPTIFLVVMLVLLTIIARKRRVT